MFGLHFSIASCSGFLSLTCLVLRLEPSAMWIHPWSNRHQALLELVKKSKVPWLAIGQSSLPSPACLRWGAKCGRFLPLTVSGCVRLCPLWQRFYRLVMSCCVQMCYAWLVTLSASNVNEWTAVTAGWWMNLPPRAEAPRSLVMQHLFATFVWSAITDHHCHDSWCFLSLTSLALGVELGEPQLEGSVGTEILFDHPMFEDPLNGTQNQFERTGSNCTW